MASPTVFNLGPVQSQDPRVARPQVPSRQPSRIITVDSILQYASDIPSAQQRRPARPKSSRTPSGKRPLDPRLSGRFMPPHMPPRSTKTSEKLVLLPEAVEEEDEKGEFGQDSDQKPPKDGQGRAAGKDVSKSYAEKLPKARRTEKELPRVTAYCVAQAYKLQTTATFIRQKHLARAKLYDDCLYCAYHLPLMPGTEGYRICSSPAVVSSKGSTLLDEAIERNEQRNFRGDYYGEESEEHSVRGDNDHGEAANDEQIEERTASETRRRDSNTSNRSMSPSGTPRESDMYRFAEMFILSYGVVVFWNFSERQEKDVLADMTFATITDPVTNIVSPVLLMTGPLEEEDFETEDFHFEYNDQISRPRLYNDMITLRNGDHMIKLAISHAIAQSTKLSYFEESMTTQMEAAKDVPGRLAKTGELGMRRSDVVKLLGGLFKSRVDVNLCKLSCFCRIYLLTIHQPRKCSMYQT